MHTYFNDHKTCHNGNHLIQVLMKPCLKRGRHFHTWNVDPSMYRNNRTRYSRKTEAKMGKLPWKETKLRKTQASLQSPKCLGSQTSVEKNIFFLANSTRPVGQVLLEIHSSELQEYSSLTGGQVEVFCPDPFVCVRVWFWWPFSQRYFLHIKVAKGDRLTV